MSISNAFNLMKNQLSNNKRLTGICYSFETYKKISEIEKY